LYSIRRERKISLGALTRYDKSDIRCETKPDPKIGHDKDAINKVTARCIKLICTPN
jgi:hypothetical protein